MVTSLVELLFSDFSFFFCGADGVVIKMEADLCKIAGHHVSSAGTTTFVHSLGSSINIRVVLSFLCVLVCYAIPYLCLVIVHYLHCPQLYTVAAAGVQ